MVSQEAPLFLEISTPEVPQVIKRSLSKNSTQDLYPLGFAITIFVKMSWVADKSFADDLGVSDN